MRTISEADKLKQKRKNDLREALENARIYAFEQRPLRISEQEMLSLLKPLEKPERTRK